MHQVHYGFVALACVCLILVTASGPWGPIKWSEAGPGVYFTAAYMVSVDADMIRGTRWSVIDYKCSYMDSMDEDITGLANATSTCSGIKHRCNTARLLVPVAHIAAAVLLVLTLLNSDVKQQSRQAVVRAALSLGVGIVMIILIAVHSADDCVLVGGVSRVLYDGRTAYDARDVDTATNTLQPGAIAVASIALIAFVAHAVLLMIPDDSKLVARFKHASQA